MTNPIRTTNLFSKRSLPLYVFLFFLIFIFFIFFYILNLQLTYQENLITNNTTIYTVDNKNIFNRNNIFFTNKYGEAIPVAINENRVNVFISPRDIEDLDETHSHIQNFFELSKEEFLLKAQKRMINTRLSKKIYLKN